MKKKKKRSEKYKNESWVATKRILSIISSIVKYVFEKINRELLEIEEYSFGYLLMLLGKRKVVGMFINEFLADGSY